MKDLQSKVIDAIRFPLAIMVVFIHLHGVEHHIPSDLSCSYLIYENSRILFSRIIPHIAVPLFYIISGYLFFVSFREHWDFRLWTTKMRRRFGTLIVPYVIWNIIPVLLYSTSVVVGMMIHQKTHDFVNDDYVRSCISWHVFWDYYKDTSIGTLPSNFPLDFPLWFIRNLIIVLAISPAIFFVVKYLKQFGIIFFLIYYLLDLQFIYLPSYYILTLVFFMIGAYCGINRKNLVAITLRLSPYSYVVCVIALSSILLFYNTSLFIYLFRVYILSGIVSFFSLTTFFVEKFSFELPRSITNSTFFVFAAHVVLPFNSWFSKIENAFFPDNVWGWTIQYFTVPFCVVASCVITYLGLSRFFPRFTRFICGR